MNYPSSSLMRGRLALAIALSAAMSVGACKASGSSDPRSLTPVLVESSHKIPIPPLPEAAVAPCRDPGVPADPVEGLIRHREALAECEDKRGTAVDAYHEIQSRFGSVPPPSETFTDGDV